MGMNFTPEQQKVIELHNSNILVSAAAGSGKTAVLVERIIRMICEGEHPADIDRLLIVTFTNAAAAEMRERIAAGIAARLEADPGNDHIQKQSALLHNAQITTIDSFSLFLIRNHFNEIGLDPDFRWQTRVRSSCCSRRCWDSCWRMPMRGNLFRMMFRRPGKTVTAER